MDAYALVNGTVGIEELAELRARGVVRAAALTVGAAGTFVAFEAPGPAQLRQAWAATQQALGGGRAGDGAATGLLTASLAGPPMPKWPSRIIPADWMAFLHMVVEPERVRAVGEALALLEPSAGVLVTGRGVGYLLEWAGEREEEVAAAVLDAVEVPGVRSADVVWTTAELTVGFGERDARGAEVARPA